ncbi:protein of unknown function [Gracilibacillus orientalis]|uniref:DUF1798 domain-containing protein n=1 Tax=Gracilibacillus orientalis TaxID=334253 RepID=A0A1I4L3W4_9BACI|nr:DUF1798 family protein [Gracilibacillus orientalis]SFL85712.1 protein of unknown function [Gracilibacillus orientalis]
MLLLTYIEELEKELLRLKEYYLAHERPENKRDPEFFAFVKENTEPIFEKVDHWNEEALNFVKNRNVKVHPQQVESTEENIKLLLLHSYYVDVKRKRYMELYQSVLYVFDSLKNDFHNL